MKESVGYFTQPIRLSGDSYKIKPTLLDIFLCHVSLSSEQLIVISNYLRVDVLK